MMALRIRSGLDVGRYTALAGHPPNAQSRASLVQMGMITDMESNITVSKQGLMVLNAVIRELLPA
jgi:oxygen-independent coproporphyrinogen-3 oxidase